MYVGDEVRCIGSMKKERGNTERQDWERERGKHEHLHYPNLRGHGTAETPRTHYLSTAGKGWVAANGRVLQFRQIKLA